MKIFMKKENILYILLIVIFIISIFSLFNYISFKVCKILNTLIVVLYFVFSILFIDKKFNTEEIFSISIVFTSLSYFIEILFLPNIFDYFLVFSFLILLFQIVQKKYDIQNHLRENFLDKSYRFYFIFLLFWIFYSLVSLIWARYKNIAYGRIQFIFYAILIFLSYDYLTNQKKLYFLTNSFFIVGIYFIIISLTEIYINKHFPSSIVFRNKMDGYVGGTTFNMNDFATFLYVFYFFILVYLFQKFNNTIIKIAFFLIITPIFYFLISKTLSRANTISLIIFFVVFLVFLILKLIYLKTKKITFVLLTILFIFLLVISSSIILVNRYKSDIINHLETYRKMINESLAKSKEVDLSSDIIRIRLILNTMKIIKNFYFMGAGPGNTQELMPMYSEKYYYCGNIKNVHNFWFELLSDYGIIVFILFLLFFFSQIFYLIKDIFIQNEEKKYLISVLSISTLMGFIISSISVSSLLTRPIVWIYFSYIIFLRNCKIDKPNIEKII